jgi:ribosomal protein S18 acetylase RimI-like enzyme
MRIRDSLPGEADALDALRRRATDVWATYREELARFPEALAVPRDWVDEGRIRVAVDDDDRPIGFAVALADQLDGLFVDPETMQRGIGRALVEDASEHARRDGFGVLCVTANENAVAFYERVGFVKVGTGPTRFGPGTRMKLDLRT